ncbi:unnamed protein product [Ectocarpus sp. 6 AP-2014]
MYHKPPSASGDDSDSSDDSSSHYRVKYHAPPQEYDDKQRPHVRFADSDSIAPSVPAEQTEAYDKEQGFDDTGPEPTEADIQRAARVSSENADYVVPEPGMISFDRDESFDDNSENGESTSSDQDGTDEEGINNEEPNSSSGEQEGTNGINNEEPNSSSGEQEGTNGINNEEPNSSPGEQEGTNGQDDRRSMSDHAKHCMMDNDSVHVTDNPLCSLSHVSEHPFIHKKETFWTMYHWISACAAHVLAYAQGEHAWRITRHNKAHRAEIMSNPCPLVAKRRLNLMESTQHSVITWQHVLNDVLLYGLLMKFETHPELKTFLVSTGDKNIIYKSNLESLNNAFSKALTTVRYHFSKGSEATEFARLRKSVHHMLQWQQHHSRRG